MHLHAALEEKFIHPLLSQRVPGGARRLEEDHRTMRQEFDDLIAHFKEVKTKPIDLDGQKEFALEFYRAWNRFTASHLPHMDYEEENVLPSLWKLCTNSELEEVFRLIVKNQTPEELRSNLEMMLPALNLSERVTILNAGRAGMSPQAFQAALKLAENVLSTSDWAVLKSKLVIT